MPQLIMVVILSPPPLWGLESLLGLKDRASISAWVGRRSRQTDKTQWGGRSSQHEARLALLTLCSARGMARGAQVPLGVISSSASSVQQQLEQVVQWLAAASCGFEWRRACGGGGGEC